MKQQIYDKENELWYELLGDYYLPCLTVPEQRPLGIWGQRRRRYLLKNRETIYTGLLLSGKLEAHLEEIDRSAEDMFLLLVDQMAACEGVTEELKAQNQMLWAQRMNGIRDRATETVNHDLIFA